ncbi:MAG: hypothetical protein AB7I59_02550 [Geminicoccaceae bacterium]
MNAIDPAGTAAPSLGRDLVAAARYYLGGRGGLLVLGAVAVAGGLVSSWGWLVAAGVAPLLLSVLPCVAMCALGLCMHRMSGGAKTPEQDASVHPDPRQLVLDMGGLDPAARPTDGARPQTTDQGIGSCCKPK